MRKMYSRVIAAAASFVIGISTISTTAYASFASFAPLPGSTRTERYSMCEYANNDDVSVLKDAAGSKANKSTLYESEFLQGTQITDANEISGAWRLLALGNYGDVTQDEYNYIRYTNCYSPLHCTSATSMKMRAIHGELRR